MFDCCPIVFHKLTKYRKITDLNGFIASVDCGTKQIAMNFHIKVLACNMLIISYALMPPFNKLLKH